MSDQLGDRMKERYEDRTRYYLPRRTYTIIRLDGVGFHNYTRPFRRPFDPELAKAIDGTAFALTTRIQGARFAYTQSDEISILLTDFAKPETEAWLDGNIQKMSSISAAAATAAFGSLIKNSDIELPKNHPIPLFDSRVFTIADPVEVENYFIWRQKDCIRNSVSGLAQFYYSQKALHGKSQDELKEMIRAKHEDWELWPNRFRRGGLIARIRENSNFLSSSFDAPVFVGSEGREQLRALIPQIWAEDEVSVKGEPVPKINKSIHCSLCGQWLYSSFDIAWCGNFSCKKYWEPVKVGGSLGE